MFGFGDLFGGSRNRRKRRGSDVKAEVTLELEAEVAKILGKEAAVFTPSGTMANQLALAVVTSPGDEVLLEEASHILQ